MKALFTFLELTMETPTNYGWFHLLSMAVIITVTVLIVIKFKDCTEEKFRKIALICWIIMVCFEFYKQTVFSFEYDVDKLTFSYQWYAFPLQLCSTPLYVLPFVAFLKDGKVRDALIAYSLSFALFGGLVVFFYPNDVFTEIIGVNIQTMVHHGLQIVTGVFFAVHERKKHSVKCFLYSIPVFIAFLVVALALNEGVFAALKSSGIDDSFNMFYISRHFANHLPILSVVYASVPYLIFLLSYTIGFVICAAIVCLAILGGIKLVYILTEEKHAKN